MWFMEAPGKFSVGQTAESLTCSILEKPHTGLDDCLRMLQACFRKRMSGHRLIEDASVLPAKWTVIIFQASPGTLCVNLLKVDRQMAEQTEFGTPQTMELVEYLKCHPLLSSKWAYCRGIQGPIV